MERTEARPYFSVTVYGAAYRSSWLAVVGERSALTCYTFGRQPVVILSYGLSMFGRLKNRKPSLTRIRPAVRAIPTSQERGRDEYTWLHYG